MVERDRSVDSRHVIGVKEVVVLATDVWLFVKTAFAAQV